MFKSVRTKLIAVTLCVQAIFILGMNGYWLNSQSALNSDVFYEKIQSTLKFLGAPIAAAVWDFDTDAVEKTLEGVAENPDFVFAEVWVEDSMFARHSQTAEWNELWNSAKEVATQASAQAATPENPLAQAADGAATSAAAAPVAEAPFLEQGSLSDGSLVFLSDLTHEGQTIGTLVLGYSENRLLDKQAKSLRDTAILTLITLAVVGLVVFAAAQSLAGPLGRVALTIQKVARSEFDFEVTDQDRNDEIGRIAEAVEEFRINSMKVQELENQAKRQQEESLRERQVMMHNLQEAFGKVVDAALRGDFSKRVDAKFDDPELSELAHSLNQLVAKTEAGLSETVRVLEAITFGNLQERMSGEFHGSFNDLKSGLNQTVETLSDLVNRITAVAKGIEIGSSEIAEGSVSLSEKTMSQATSLQETTTTMVELSRTVSQNSNDSEDASAFAFEAAKGAEGAKRSSRGGTRRRCWKRVHGRCLRSA